ncbi:MAG: M20/M25/M40 family metallo-hydrolase [Bacteroidetes bacterium]|nr:M20/M25/M40 family metallo-hydrolase [Bacteroidota bacterium]MBS1541145.1 M20/M25/M40 family metallo-hydrolase [Bacteroidota bacterium]
MTLNKPTIFLLLICGSAFSQKVDKIIKEKDVTRIIKTLSADDMMGRPAKHPDQIDKATSFIEHEFKKIGLKPLNGLSGFRQEFKKEMISPAEVNVTLDDEKIASDHIVIVSEKAEIHFTKGLTIQSIPFDKEATNNSRYFFGKAFSFIRDTSSSLVLVAPEFESNFKELEGFMKDRFAQGGKSTKVFVLGKSTATTYSVKAKQHITTIKMNNVAGRLEGKSKPHEIVVFSGHYDHLGIRKPVNGDSIANGADDDASGTTAVIELAKYFKKQKNNNRTLIFVAFTAEEIGGYGSQYFSQQLNADNVVAMFNIEMIGKPSKWGKSSAFITGFERSDFGSILQKNLEGTPFQFHPDPYPEQQLFYRSDNATLARLGVPAHSISTDQIDTDKLYHSVDDEFESLDTDNLTKAIKAIALSARSIVEGTDTPKRIDKATVK